MRESQKVKALLIYHKSDGVRTEEGGKYKYKCSYIYIVFE
jgi:hypothetical protein